MTDTENRDNAAEPADAGGPEGEFSGLDHDDDFLAPPDDVTDDGPNPEPGAGPTGLGVPLPPD